MVKRCAESHGDWTVLETGTIDNVWEKFKEQNIREEEERTSRKSEAAKRKVRRLWKKKKKKKKKRRRKHSADENSIASACSTSSTDVTVLSPCFLTSGIFSNQTLASSSSPSSSRFAPSWNWTTARAARPSNTSTLPHRRALGNTASETCTKTCSNRADFTSKPSHACRTSAKATTSPARTS